MGIFDFIKGKEGVAVNTLGNVSEKEQPKLNRTEVPLPTLQANQEGLDAFFATFGPFLLKMRAVLINPEILNYCRNLVLDFNSSPADFYPTHDDLKEGSPARRALADSRINVRLIKMENDRLLTKEQVDRQEKEAWETNQRKEGANNVLTGIPQAVDYARKNSEFAAQLENQLTTALAALEALKKI